MDKIKSTINRIVKFFKEFNYKEYASTNKLFIIFIVTSLLNGMLVRHFSVGGIFSYSPIMADLVFILVVGSFGYFITPKHQFKYYIAMSIFLTAICAVNSIYYNNTVFLFMSPKEIKKIKQDLLLKLTEKVNM